MKFFAYAALVASTSAVRLVHKHNSMLSLEKGIPAPGEVWDKFDTDKSDTWNLAEAKAAFKGAMKHFGHKLPADWEAHVEKEFKHADGNGNGEVTPKEMGVYLFEMVDENGDGEWCKKEAQDAVQAVAKFSGNELEHDWKKSVNDAFDAADTNKDDRVSPKEVLKALDKNGVPNINSLFKPKAKALKLSDLIALEKHVPHPEEIWKEFDADKDGEWDLAEATAAFKKGMEYFGHELPKGWEKELKTQFGIADADNSGKVSPKEMAVYIFQAIDANDDGEISLGEMKGAIKAVAEFTGNTLIKDWEKHVDKAFNTIDTDDSKKISGKEAWAALEKYGIPNINDLFEKLE